VIPAIVRQSGGRIVEKEPCVVQVAITCKHGQLNANQQEYITRKSEKLLTYFERVTAINVTVAFDNGRVRVEILVDAEHKHNFVANDQGDDVAPTFDLALHKMEHQIRKYKEKIQDHRRDLPLNELGPVE
jgi:putative sigma-54 modulation protein